MPAPPHRVRRATRWLPALLVAAALPAWASSLEGTFVFDDLSRIYRNPEIRAPASLGELVSDTSRPVLKVSLAANHALGGDDPRGYHVVNLAIHLLAGLALFGALRRSLATRAETRDAAPWLAAAAALLWLLHPLQTQAVTYIVQRGEGLMGLAALSTLYFTIRCAEGTHPRAWGAAAVTCCAVGMGTKEVMVVVPPLVLLHDRTFLAGSFAAALRSRWALYLGLAATWGIPFGLIGTATLFGGEFARPELPTASPLAYGLTQPRILLHYLRLALWPHPLCFDYQWPPAETWGEILPAALVVSAALGATAWGVGRRTATGFLGAWFFGILAPTSSFLPIQDLAVEHRMYLPLAAVATAVVLAGYRALEPLGARRAPVGGALVAAASLALGWATAERNRDYHDPLVLWQSVVDVAPHNARGHYNLGVNLRRLGRHDEAISAYLRSVELAPDRPRAHYNLANVLRDSGRTEEALRHYQRAVALEPLHGSAHVNLGNLLRAEGDPAGATRHYRQAIEASPEDGRAHYNLAVILQEQGDPDAAERHYRESIRLRPNASSAYHNLGNLMRHKGHLEEAIDLYETALRLGPGNPRAHTNLGIAFEQAAQRDEAIANYRRALRFDPEYERARRRLRALMQETAP